jgi:hypothetical protein
VTQPGTDRPYRVIVWGPGHIGGTVLREVIKRDDLELVGVKVYSEEKAGADAGAVAVRTHRGYIGERLVYTNVEYWYWGLGCRYIGPENDVPFGPGDSNLDYVIDIAGRPGHIRLRLDVGDNTGDDIPVATWLSVTTLLQSIRPVVAAEPGILYHESSPNISDLRPSVALERVE